MLNLLRDGVETDVRVGADLLSGGSHGGNGRDGEDGLEDNGDAEGMDVDDDKSAANADRGNAQISRLKPFIRVAITGK